MRVRGMVWRTLDKKSMPIVAWYVLSNESYMNRVINDVLPTVVNVRPLILVALIGLSA